MEDDGKYYLYSPVGFLYSPAGLNNPTKEIPLKWNIYKEDLKQWKYLLESWLSNVGFHYNILFMLTSEACFL